MRPLCQRLDPRVNDSLPVSSMDHLWTAPLEGRGDPETGIASLAATRRTSAVRQIESRFEDLPALHVAHDGVVDYLRLTRRHEAALIDRRSDLRFAGNP